MEYGPTVFPAAASWDAFVESTGKVGYNFFKFLRDVFPTLQTADVKTVEQAFQLVQQHEMIQLNWVNPMEPIPERGSSRIMSHSHFCSNLKEIVRCPKCPM